MVACVDWISFTVLIDRADREFIETSIVDQNGAPVLHQRLAGHAEHLAHTLLPSVPVYDWRMGTGFNGFHARISYEGVDIMYAGTVAGGTSEMMCVSVSGAGCRTIEHHWADMQTFLAWVQAHAHSITRIDLAMDDRDGLLDIVDLYRRSDVRWLDDGIQNDRCMWWGKPRTSSQIRGTQGTTLYFGSSKSAVMVRIYDKAKEQKMPIGIHWVRTEVVLRQEKASACVALLVECDDAGSIIGGILRDQLLFLDCPITDLPSAHEAEYALDHIYPVWETFLGACDGIRLQSSTKKVRTWESIQKYVEIQTIRSLAVWCDILGLGCVEDLVKRGKEKYRLDDRAIVDRIKGQSVTPTAIYTSLVEIGVADPDAILH